MRRIGIIGFGFSGLMVAANLLRQTQTPITLYILDEDMDARGVAYGSTNPEHLLNVRASNMSAFADAATHLVEWLASPEGRQMAEGLGLRNNYGPTDFIPRMLYGAYLSVIWREVQHEAVAKQCALKLVQSRAVAVHGGAELAILSARGDAIAVDEVVLAVGHEPRPVLTQLDSAHIIRDLWAPNVLDGAKDWASPVIVMGAGLTAIDALLSLRRASYAGEVIMSSRSTRLPMVHEGPFPPLSYDANDIARLKTLRAIVHFLRAQVKKSTHWQQAIDAMRPHTQTLWKHLSPREQQRALKLLMGAWNIHRHRMAPEIGAVLMSEMNSGRLKLATTRSLSITADEHGALSATLNGETLAISRVINCVGLTLDVAHSGNALLRQLLADGAIEEHVTRQGITADHHLRAWGRLHPKLYVVGSLLTGQLLESTAVPELRAQAADIAKTVASG